MKMKLTTTAKKVNLFNAANNVSVAFQFVCFIQLHAAGFGDDN